jgi:putative molybdopterin biosynthesis protein
VSDLLRRLRRARGLSQAQVAEELGISRQAVAGIEAGAFEPSLAVALRLARFFDTSVEELFDEPDRLVEASVELLEPAAPGERLDVVAVAGRLVGVPRGGERGLVPGFQPVGAQLLTPETVQLRTSHPPRALVAGCDPALALLAGPLAHRRHPIELVWWPASSRDALRALERGLVHAAGFHVPLDAAGRWRWPRLARPIELRAFTSWREGLVLRERLERDLRSLRTMRLANRQEGAEARELLAASLRSDGIEPRELSGWESQVSSHLMVAEAVWTGVADVGVALEPAAAEFKLAFVPLADERFLLAVPLDPPREDAAIYEALEAALASQELRRAVAAIPGYRGLEVMGERLGVADGGPNDA